MSIKVSSAPERAEAPRVKLVLVRILTAVIALVGLTMVAGGMQLIALGGSPYYLIAGALYVVGAVLMWRRRAIGVWIVAAVLILTLPWAVWESSFRYWPLFPRLLMPAVLAALALFAAPTVDRFNAGRKSLINAVVLMALTLVGVAGAFLPHNLIESKDEKPLLATGDNQPSDWTSYGRTTKGTRFAPFNQINSANVDKLKLAWTYHSGDHGPGIDQNTPLQIGDTVYTCSPNDMVAALDADTGKPRWKFNAHASSPYWQRCRSLGFYDENHGTASAPDAPATPGICSKRIINTTIDARLIALDAATGAPCPDFGTNGVVNLAAGMGPVKPGYYFETSGPLIARDLIIVGGWVVDNQETGEPSGVIRAFSARTGELVWAWDLGNPAITKDPPPGGMYTRATPNMWSTASYDDKLGLIYLPLGNQTPDYYGPGRLPQSTKYNSSIVALDVTTGRERWKVQTVHHDIWDYDLPSQPALVDVPDGKGNTVPALLQTTKRGQLFLLNRETGVALADVVEKPVPQKGAVPEETLSPTQPYSVGMPTIGDEHLSEKKMWGMTTLDQLWCRIDFHRHRYEGDFTPIGLTRALEQPGNLGGLNWGSVSVDPYSNYAYMVDIRVPTEFWLTPRANYANETKKYPADPNGHGPGPQAGTPYGMVTLMWQSPFGVPCSEPPFGTVTAVDLNKRKIAWQIPAGTAEELGPLGLTSHMPMPIGMPSYAGTLATAGGLVFYAGTQDFYLRAYDAHTGKEVWKQPLPVGSSATPMTYVSPTTGKQYILLSVGGAAHSSKTGDYVMAFALPDDVVKAGK